MEIAVERIESKIFQIWGKKVMLDRDLAELYAVETKYLKRQVRRNAERFPSDFMFELSEEEFRDWRRQFVTSSSRDKKGLRYSPYAFTEHGILMLSSVLNCKKAIAVNIAIMRVFVNLRRIGLTYVGLKRKIEAMENKYDAQFKAVFEAIKALLSPVSAKEQKVIKGFRKD